MADQYEIQQVGCGVCQQQTLEDEEQKYRRQYMEQLNGGQSQQIQDSSYEQGTMKWLWIALIIVLILVVLYILMRNKKRSNGGNKIASPRRR